MYTNSLFPQVQSAVNGAQTLAQLMIAVDECMGAMSEQDRANVDLTMLPTYGGDAPRQTYGVWSWDAGSVLVGDGPGYWQIISRSEFAQ